MSVDIANLLACMELRETGPGKYEGDNLAIDYRRVFGGQLLAQSIIALARTFEGKALKSFTQHFPREGDVALPMSYHVETEQNGRTFATASVRASQNGKLISRMAASLHTVETGLERQDEAPAVAGPSDCAPAELDMIPWDLKIVDGIDLGDRAARPAVFRFWMRIPTLRDHPGADSQWLHQALLAHATDLTVIGTALLPMPGVSQNDTGTVFHSAVTSHSMWFHNALDMSEWVLVDQSSPVLAGGRAFGRADVWSAGGKLVASLTQEAMIRLLG